MKETRILMGMPIKIEIVEKSATEDIFGKAFSYFQYVDDKFSVYKNNSEITRINEGKIKTEDWSDDMREIFILSEKTKRETGGYFDIQKADGKYDPSGLVKGWAIWKVSKLLKENGFKNFYVDAGGDIQVSGKNGEDKKWSIGIRDPFHLDKIVKVVYLDNVGIATSGIYERGNHIYNPKNRVEKILDIVSLSVIGPNVYEADRFATASFAMGNQGIFFLDRLKGFEGYMIDKNGIGTMTSGFEKYTI